MYSELPPSRLWVILIFLEHVCMEGLLFMHLMFKPNVYRKKYYSGKHPRLTASHFPSAGKPAGIYWGFL